MNLSPALKKKRTHGSSEQPQAHTTLCHDLLIIIHKKVANNCKMKPTNIVKGSHARGALHARDLYR